MKSSENTLLDAPPILTSNTRCFFKSKYLLSIADKVNKVKINVSVIFSLR